MIRRCNKVPGSGNNTVTKAGRLSGDDGFAIRRVTAIRWSEMRDGPTALPAAGRRSGIPITYRVQYLERVPADPFGHQRIARDH